MRLSEPASTAGPTDDRTRGISAANWLLAALKPPIRVYLEPLTQPDSSDMTGTAVRNANTRTRPTERSAITHVLSHGIKTKGRSTTTSRKQGRNLNIHFFAPCGIIVSLETSLMASAKSWSPPYLPMWNGPRRACMRPHVFLVAHTAKMIAITMKTRPGKTTALNRKKMLSIARAHIQVTTDHAHSKRPSAIPSTHCMTPYSQPGMSRSHWTKSNWRRVTCITGPTTLDMGQDYRTSQ